MIEKDFHGLSLGDAIREVEYTVSSVRIAGKTEQAEFITGHGAIRTGVFNVLRKYSLAPYSKLGNQGVIIVIIE